MSIEHLPVRLALTHGWRRVGGRCSACGRSKVVDVVKLVSHASLNRSMTLIEIARRLRCQGCRQYGTVELLYQTEQRQSSPERKHRSARSVRPRRLKSAASAVSRSVSRRLRYHRISIAVERLVVIVAVVRALEVVSRFLFGSSTGVLTGHARVIDGDTIAIRGRRIRLEGIDAPETAQTCWRNGTPFACGVWSAGILRELIGGRPVRCVESGRDRYGRVLAVCFAGGTDLNAAMVRLGAALAYRRYSRAYVRVEDLARRERAGLWGMTFQRPWAWRRVARD